MPTDLQVADILTKALLTATYEFLCSKLNLACSPQFSLRRDVRVSSIDSTLYASAQNATIITPSEETKAIRELDQVCSSPHLYSGFAARVTTARYDQAHDHHDQGREQRCALSTRKRSLHRWLVSYKC